MDIRCRIRGRRVFRVLIASLFAWIFWTPDALGAKPLVGDSPQLEVIMMDVGQGDGIFLRTPGGKHILIDAGPDARRGVLPFLRSRQIKRIDFMVLSHPHADHIGGAISPRNDYPRTVNSVLEYCEVGEILDSGRNHPTPEYRSLLEEIKSRGISYRQPRTGEKLNWDPALKVTVLHPDAPKYENVNDNSIMLRIVYRQVSFVFTGDGEEEAEHAAVSEFGSRLGSDVLKVGHHGSRTSTTQEFLDAVSPRYALISCGYRNSFRHPRTETLDKLDDIGARVLRTDQDGYLSFKTDGENIRWTRSPVPFPKAELARMEPIDVSSDEWRGKGRQDGGDLELSAEPGQNIWIGESSAPTRSRPIPADLPWTFVVSVRPPEGEKMEAGVMLFSDRKNFLLFGIQDERMLSLTVVRDGNLILGPELIVSQPSRIGLRQTAQAIEALAYDDDKETWRVLWSLSKREQPGLDDRSRLGVYVKSWGRESGAATFRKFMFGGGNG